MSSLGDGAIPSTTLLPGTTLDIIQDELEDTADGTTQRHHSHTTSEATSPHHAQNAVSDTPRCYPTCAREGPDCYGNFVSH